MIASTQTNSPLAGSARTPSRHTALLEQAAAHLKSAGLRVTQPRLAIVSALGRQSCPVTIEKIHAEVGMAKCDLVTVYRCMAAFEKIGLVRRGFYHNGTALFQLTLGQPQRFHFVCRDTNEVVEIDPDLSRDLQQAIDAVERELCSRGYSEVAHVIEFFGKPPTPVRGAAAPMPAVR